MSENNGLDRLYYLNRSTSLLVSYINRALYRAGSLNLTEYMILKEISQSPRIHQQTLIERLNITAPTISQRVNNLINLHYVDAEAYSFHREMINLSITPSGLITLDTLRLAKIHSHYGFKLSQEEIRLVEKITNQIIEYISARDPRRARFDPEPN